MDILQQLELRHIVGVLRGMVLGLQVVEFIVDKDAIPEDAAAMGDMSYGTPMQGKVVSIYRV